MDSACLQWVNDRGKKAQFFTLTDTSRVPRDLNINDRYLYGLGWGAN